MIFILNYYSISLSFIFQMTQFMEQVNIKCIFGNVFIFFTRSRRITHLTKSLSKCEVNYFFL